MMILDEDDENQFIEDSSFEEQKHAVNKDNYDGI